MIGRMIRGGHYLSTGERGLRLRLMLSMRVYHHALKCWKKRLKAGGGENRWKGSCLFKTVLLSGSSRGPSYLVGGRRGRGGSVGKGKIRSDTPLFRGRTESSGMNLRGRDDPLLSSLGGESGQSRSRGGFKVLSFSRCSGRALCLG